MEYITLVIILSVGLRRDFNNPKRIVTISKFKRDSILSLIVFFEKIKVYERTPPRITACNQRYFWNKPFLDIGQPVRPRDKTVPCNKTTTFKQIYRNQGEAVFQAKISRASCMKILVPEGVIKVKI